jgi:arylsulfatase A-like enzyme
MRNDAEMRNAPRVRAPWPVYGERLRVAAVACLSLVASVTPAAAEPREESNRAPVFAARKGDGGALDYVPVRVGEERRLSMADGGRVQLALRPVQASAGGRIFLFAKVPGDLQESSFFAEFMVWRGGHWERHKVLEKKKGELGHLSTTLTLPDLGAGPIPTAVFRRVAEHGKLQSVVSTARDVPSKARLKFGYSFDEWDWTDLSPVEITVTAVIPDKKSKEGKEVRIYRQRVEPQGESPRWFDAEADLSSIKGEDVRFIFRAEPMYVSKKLAPHVVFSAPTIVAGKPDGDMPSVVLVVLDGVRARSLGMYGGSKDVSPALDRLFTRDGAVFENAITQAADSIPAVMTLFTGLYPCAHQIASARQTLAREIEPFAQTMASGGYATAAFTDAAGIAAETGFGRGFEVFYQTTSLELRATTESAAAPFARAAEWIKAHADEPFVAVVHSRQAKPPYFPPPSRGSGPAPPAAGSVQDERARYEREIHYLDELIGSFVGDLDKESDPDRTLLVVTSGHGEEFAEHGALEHGTHLYDETIRVPLLLRGPGVRSKKRYEEVVGLVDVAPTVLELTGFDVPSAMQGMSLAEAVRKGKDLKTGARFSEAHADTRKLPTGTDPNWEPPAHAVRDGGRKLIQSTHAGRPVFEAYDLATDPGEKSNLLRAGQPAWANALRTELDAHAIECKRAARPAAKTETLPVSTLFKLKAFGYL